MKRETKKKREREREREQKKNRGFESEDSTRSCPDRGTIVKLKWLRMKRYRKIRIENRGKIFNGGEKLENSILQQIKLEFHTKPVFVL